MSAHAADLPLDAPAPARARSAPSLRWLTSARSLGALTLALFGLATLLAGLAGETAMAFWASVAVFPLVTPVAYAYVLELAIMHAVWAPAVVESFGLVAMLATLVRAVGLLEHV
jgi:hypothetical protein